MEPPPPPSSGRFRLRIQIIDKKDVHNVAAAPHKAFTIAKNVRLPLPDLTLNELCAEIVKRYQQLYPGQSLFAVDKTQDSSGSDLWLDDTVSDLFADNDVFRVIKGAPVRASVEPHRARSQSLQPNVSNGQYGQSYLKTFEASNERPAPQRVHNFDPDRPIVSRELESIENNLQPRSLVSSQVSVIPDSQQSTLDNGHAEGVNGSVQVSSSIRPSRQSVDAKLSAKTVATDKQASPELGGYVAAFPADLDDELVFPFDSDRVEDSVLPKTSLSGVKRKLSTTEYHVENQRRSSTSATSHPNPESGVTRKKLKRVATYGNSSRSRKPRAVYEEVDSEHEGVGPTTPLPQSISALKMDARYTPRTPSTHSSNGRSAREDSAASIARSLKSSPEDPTERLRRAKEAQLTALKKERDRKEAAQREEEARRREAEERIDVLTENDNGKRTLTDEDQARIAKEKRRIADAERAARERQRIIQENAKREFEAERLRIATAKENERRQEQMSERIAVEVAEQRRAESLKERKLQDVEDSKAEKTRVAKANELEQQQAKEQKEARLADAWGKVEEVERKRQDMERRNAWAKASRDAESQSRARKAAERHAQDANLDTIASQSQKTTKRKADLGTVNLRPHSKTTAAQESPVFERAYTHEPSIDKAMLNGDETHKTKSVAFDANRPRSQGLSSNGTINAPMVQATRESMFARAIREHEMTSHTDDMGSDNAQPQEPQKSKRVSCTPHIPRGKPAGPLPPTQASSQATALLPSQPPPSAGVGIETQMPLPRSFRRSVSFAEQSVAKKSPTSAGKPKLKQSFLAPVRIAAASAKGVSSRTSVKRANKTKGKERAPAIQGSPPNPIQISSDDSKSEYESDDLDIVYPDREDGPAYPRGKKPDNKILNSPTVPISSLKSCLKGSGSEPDHNKTALKLSTSSRNGVEPAQKTSSTKLNDNLKLLSAAGFPIPPRDFHRPALGFSSQFGSEDSVTDQNAKFSLGSSGMMHWPSKSSTNTVAAGDTPRKAHMKTEELQNLQSQPLYEIAQSEAELPNPKTIVAQTWSFDNSKVGEMDDGPPSHDSAATTATSESEDVHSSPELPPRAELELQVNDTSNDDSISTQSEIDQQLMSQSRESLAQSSSPSSSSSSLSPARSPVERRGRLARMTKELLADVAAKKALANSEPILRAKRDQVERQCREANEAAAAAENLSSTETESDSDSVSSDESLSLSEDDPRVQGNLYNGTGFRKSDYRKYTQPNGSTKQIIGDPRRGRKYQKHPMTGRMVKVGKYQYIDKKTGKVMGDSKRELAGYNKRKVQ